MRICYTFFMIHTLSFYQERAKEEFKKFYQQHVSGKVKPPFFSSKEETCFWFLGFGSFLSLPWLLVYHHEHRSLLSLSTLELLKGLEILLGTLATFCVFMIILSNKKRAHTPSPNILYPLLADALHYTYKGKIDKKDFPSGLATAIRKGFICNFDVEHAFSTQTDGLLLDVWKAQWIVPGGEDEPDISYYGMVVSGHLHTALKGTTLLVSDDLDAKLRGKLTGFKRIKLEWIEFEKTFDLFSTDETEARIVMAPDTMEALYDFYKQKNNKSLSFMFEKDTLSCFYVVGEDDNLWNKNNLEELFCHLYILKFFPQLIHYKMLASAWQEEKYLQKYKEEETAARMRLAVANIPDDKGITPLMRSILNNDYPTFKKYISEPYTDVNQCFAPKGNTLLHLAVLNNRVDMASFLIALPAVKKHVRNNQGQTALDMARARGYTAIVRLLEDIHE